MVNEDIEAIISRGEERTNELNTKYEGLTFEDLSNFKSEASVQQWEGEDFRTGVCLLDRRPNEFHADIAITVAQSSAV